MLKVALPGGISATLNDRGSGGEVDERAKYHRWPLQSRCSGVRWDGPVGTVLLVPALNRVKLNLSKNRVTAYGALVRLMRRRKHAIRTTDSALRQLRLYSVRLLFHAHPAQFADQFDELVRRSLICRNVRSLLLFERH